MIQKWGRGREGKKANKEHIMSNVYNCFTIISLRKDGHNQDICKLIFPGNQKSTDPKIVPAKSPYKVSNHLMTCLVMSVSFQSFPRHPHINTPMVCRLCVCDLISDPNLASCPLAKDPPGPRRGSQLPLVLLKFDLSTCC